jgi:tetraacyldisaccharide 4'-kinase
MNHWMLPFSWLYGAVTHCRNWMYDHEWKKAVTFDLPVLSVGNLSVGGTGKTPAVAYLISLLRDRYRVGVLSRGYGRTTKGYRNVDLSDTAELSGDEPLEIKRRFTDIAVAVCEERAIGIPIMLLDDPALQVIILDDAFQHRKVKPALSLLLTDYSRPFTRDKLLPAGRLRESVSNAARADAIVITKVPEAVNQVELSSLISEVKAKDDQPVFVSTLSYGEMVHLLDRDKKLQDTKDKSVLLVSGIASSSAILAYLRRVAADVEEIRFGDHHRYTLHDLKRIIAQAKGKRRIIVTTEKDAVRLLPFREQIRNEGVEIYCIPVAMAFDDTERKRFNEFVIGYISSSFNNSANE